MAGRRNTRGARSWTRSSTWCGPAVHGGNYQRTSRRGTVYWYFNGWEQRRRRRPTRVAGHLGVPRVPQQGIATELIRRVLDDVRAQGKTVTIMCPIVRTFIENNPEYADLIDSKHPGVTKGDR